MGLIPSALLIMGVMGILFGIGLAIASRFFHTESDSRVEQIIACLPGANCGACGFAGCEGYAKAVVEGTAAPDLCVPGGPKAALGIGEIMGVAVDVNKQPVRAVVHCQGGTDRCGQRFAYNGLADCRAANLVQGGPKNCEYGCLGYGTCMAACSFDAIIMGADRIPVIDWDKCTACGACVRACPRALIDLLPTNISHVVACSSQDKGKAVKDVCSVGCIACWICVKNAPEGAINKKGNLAVLTYPAGCDYTQAADKCPMHCFVKVEAAGSSAQASLQALSH